MKLVWSLPIIREVNRIGNHVAYYVIEPLKSGSNLDYQKQLILVMLIQLKGALLEQPGCK